MPGCRSSVRVESCRHQIGPDGPEVARCLFCCVVVGIGPAIQSQRLFGHLDSREGYAQLSAFQDDLICVSSDYNAFHVVVRWLVGWLWGLR